MKSCTDCDHFRILRGELVTFRMCHNPKTVNVAGETLDCLTARKGTACGPDAKLWEPIRPHAPPTLWERLFLGSFDDNGRRLVPVKRDTP